MNNKKMGSLSDEINVWQLIEVKKVKEFIKKLKRELIHYTNVERRLLKKIDELAGPELTE